ncbi:hypothetical protein ATY76_03745 [Rhizobium sp. R339]|nr:hypothetical protein ATY76_03745 [Rhizobium sp. R339]
MSGNAKNAWGESEGQWKVCREAPSSDPSGHLLPAGEKTEQAARPPSHSTSLKLGEASPHPLLPSGEKVAVAG